MAYIWGMRGVEVPRLEARPEDMRVLELLVAALWGFLIGGLFADAFVYALEVISAGVALGSISATGVWLVRYQHRDLPRFVAIGGFYGAWFGALVLIVDALVG
jgi:hypothetical protein